MNPSSADFKTIYAAVPYFLGDENTTTFPTWDRTRVLWSFLTCCFNTDQEAMEYIESTSFSGKVVQLQVRKDLSVPDLHVCRPQCRQLGVGDAGFVPHLRVEGSQVPLCRKPPSSQNRRSRSLHYPRRRQKDVRKLHHLLFHYLG